MTLVQKMQALACSAVLVSSLATYVSYLNKVVDIKKEESLVNSWGKNLKNAKNENYSDWTFSQWSTSGDEANNSSWF